MPADPWPESLPCFTVEDFGENHGENRLRSQNDTGPAKVRRRQSAAPRPLQLGCVVTREQLASFRSFYDETLLSGVLPFTIPDQTAAGVWLVRFGEDAYQISRFSAQRWFLRLSLEILP